MKTIAQPLHSSSCDKDASLECILHFVIEAPRDGRDKTVSRLLTFCSGVHQHKASGTISIFCHPGFEASLAKEGSLLIPGNAANRDLYPLEGISSEGCRAGLYFRQDDSGNIKLGEHSLVPG